MPPFPVRRWTVDEYRHLSEAGILSDDDRVELLEGWIVPKMTHNPPHDWMVSRLTRLLLGAVGEQWVVRTQCAINTADSEPEPDIAIVNGPDDRYLERHPQAEDVAVVIEVADTSVRKDRAKASIYAAAGVPEYWIINLVNEQVEVHRDPQPAQRVYGSRNVLSGTDVARLLLGDTVGIESAVSQLLPPSV